MGESISVIIPTYYRNRRLEDCIRRVREIGYVPTETIVVDDSGEDHAKHVVDSYDDVIYLSHSENRGAQAARSTGLQAASGEYVQFLDDDDLLLDGKFRKQVDVFREQPETGVVYCGLVLSDGTCLYPDQAVRGDVLQDALAFRDSTWKTSTMLIKYSALKKILPLVTDSKGADDVRMRIRLAQVTEFDFITEPAVRIGEGKDRRGHSLGTIQELWELIKTYEPLYESVHPRIRRQAMAEAYGYTGRYYLRQQCWSSSAITAFAKAVYHAPDGRFRRGGEFLASLFGRPGMKVGQYLTTALS